MGVTIPQKLFWNDEVDISLSEGKTESKASLKVLAYINRCYVAFGSYMIRLDTELESGGVSRFVLC